MNIVEEAVRLVVYLSEPDNSPNSPSYKAIVRCLKESGIWGASVVRGMTGFGKRGVIHKPNPFRLYQEMPIVIEVVDSRKKIEEILPRIEVLAGNALITLKEVRTFLQLN